MLKIVLVVEKMKSLIEVLILCIEWEGKVIKFYRLIVKNIMGIDLGEINFIFSIRLYVVDWFLWYSGRVYNIIN